jgi:hypothetical protein
MVAYTCNPSTQEAEAGDREFKANLGYIVRPYLKKKKVSKKKKVLCHNAIERI